MEHNLFSWEHYDVLPNLIVVFRGCTLNSNIFVQGQAVGWHLGHKMQEIEVDYLGGTIKFVEDGEVLEEFVVELKIWERR